MKITKSALRQLIKEELKNKPLNEAEEVQFNTLKPQQQKQIQAIEKVLGGKHSQIWDGIHGMIVMVNAPSLRKQARFEAEDLKKLLALKIRWIEADGNDISVGF